MKEQKRSANSVESLVLTSFFSAIILLMAFTPLGLIDLPIIKATILHVPVIIGSVMLGPWKGAFFGGLFGVCSLIKNTMAPSALSFAFSPLVPLPGEAHGSPWALVICLIPRILTGIVPYFVYTGIKAFFSKRFNADFLGYIFAAVAGSVTNTCLVMGTIWLVLKDSFAAAQGIAHDLVNGAVLTIVFSNGIPEAIAAAIITPLVCLAVSAATKRMKGRKK